MIATLTKVFAIGARLWLLLLAADCNDSAECEETSLLQVGIISVKLGSDRALHEGSTFESLAAETRTNVSEGGAAPAAVWPGVPVVIPQSLLPRGTVVLQPQWIAQQVATSGPAQVIPASMVKPAESGIAPASVVTGQPAAAAPTRQVLAVVPMTLPASESVLTGLSSGGAAQWTPPTRQVAAAASPSSAPLIVSVPRGVAPAAQAAGVSSQPQQWSAPAVLPMLASVRLPDGAVAIQGRAAPRNVVRLSSSQPKKPSLQEEANAEIVEEMKNTQEDRIAEIVHDNNVSFAMSSGGQYCQSGADLTSEEDCRAAAAALGKTWASSGNPWYGPGDHKYCMFADDEWQQVFFNSAGAAAAAVPPRFNYASVCLEVCADKVVTSGGESMEPACMGEFTKSPIKPSSSHGGRPIYENNNGRHMYFWEPAGNWIIETDGSFQNSYGVVYAHSDVKCPEAAGGWKIWDKSGWSPPGLITVSKAVDERAAAQPVQEEIQMFEKARPAGPDSSAYKAYIDNAPAGYEVSTDRKVDCSGGIRWYFSEEDVYNCYHGGQLSGLDNSRMK